MPQYKWKLDKKLTAMMVEDMIFDPILAAKVILRVSLPPHEELRVMWMWSTYYTNDDSGFSTGKSWTAALVAALRSCLMPNRVGGVLSKTFSQGKLIFANLDRWYVSSPIFRSCIKHIQGKPRLVHGSDAWVAYFRGGSEIRVLPPNFLQDAERIRSERWHDAYLDEWTTYGNFRALNTTIMGRVTNINRFPNCPVRQNHVHLFSTPNFEHHPAYKMVKVVSRQMARGNKDYSRFTCNYRHIPDTEQWRWLVSRKTIFHLQNTLPKGIKKAEIDGLWSKDSETFYSAAMVNKIRSVFQGLMQRLGTGELYFGGIDVARGGGDMTTSTQGDDFSMSTFRVIIGEWFPHHVNTIRRSKLTDDQMAALVHSQEKKFGYSLIVYDPGGGGLFVRDKLRNTKQVIDNKETICTPLLTLTDRSGAVGKQILVPFARNDYYIAQMWGKMASDSVLINRLHNEFKGAIENKKVALASEWKGWDNSESAWDVGARRVWLNEQLGLSTEDKLKAEMDLAVSQLILVDPDRNKDGSPITDSYGMYKFSSTQKKDAAYGLVYAFMGWVIYQWMLESGITAGNSDDNEEAACAMEEI